MKKHINLILVIAIILVVFISKKDDIYNYIKKFENATLLSFTDSQTDFEEVIVERVVDGDTIIVIDDQGNSFRVRLIGIDTPESVHPDEEKNTESGTVASEYTKSRLLPGATVFLQYDEEKTDVYNRTLAYLWLSNNVDCGKISDIEKYMYNAELILKGYAIPKEYAPNVMYSDIFVTLYERATM